MGDMICAPTQSRALDDARSRVSSGSVGQCVEAIVVGCGEASGGGLGFARVDAQRWLVRPHTRIEGRLGQTPFQLPLERRPIPRYCGRPHHAGDACAHAGGSDAWRGRVRGHADRAVETAQSVVARCDSGGARSEGAQWRDGGGGDSAGS